MIDIVSRFERIVSNTPDKPAFVFGHDIISFLQFRNKILQVSAHLGKLGVGQRHRCIISSTNNPDTASVIAACWYRGAIPVLINELSPPEHLHHAVQITDPSLVIKNEPTLANLPSAHRDVPVHAISDIAFEAQAIQAIHSPASRTLRSIPCAHDIASIIFTSGSSGMPKGVAQTHHTLVSACMSVVSHLGITSSDKVLCPVPWSFDYGYGQLLSTIVCGITQIIPKKNDAFSICETVNNSKPTVFAGLPSLMGALCKGLNPIEKVDTSPIRLLTNTGAKLHADLLTAVKDAFPNSQISLNYGLTETYRSASLPVDLVNKHSDSVGFAMPGVELVVVRKDKTLADPDEPGEIVHRGLGSFQGYWGDPDKTNAVLKQDPYWKDPPLSAMKSVYTGDIGWKDAQGLLYISGRNDRQIKTMGVRVSPDEIESIVQQYEYLSEVAVTAQAHELYGSLIQVAYTVQDESGFSLKELKKYCRNNMSPYMLPREFHELETLPRTPSGKTDYVSLKKLLSKR